MTSTLEGMLSEVKWVKSLVVLPLECGGFLAQGQEDNKTIGWEGVRRGIKTGNSFEQKCKEDDNGNEGLLICEKSGLKLE